MRLRDQIRTYGWEAFRCFAAGVQPSFLSHVFYVDRNNPDALDADDSIHGTCWESPFATIEYAILRHHDTVVSGSAEATNANEWWGQNNYILIAPGIYEEDFVFATHRYISGCTIIGLGSCIDYPTTEASVSIKSSTASIIDAASMVACTIKNIHFECNLASGTSVSIATMNNSAFINCRFHTNIANLSKHLSIGDMTRSTIRGCVFSSGTTHAATAIEIGASSKTVFFGSKIENNIIDAATTGILVNSSIALSGGGTWIRGNEIVYPAKGIDINASSGGLIRIVNNTIMASSDCIEGSNAAYTTGNWANQAGTGDWEIAEPA